VHVFRVSVRAVVARVLLDSALRGYKRVTDRDVDVLVRLIVSPPATKRELLVGQVDVYVHLVQVPLLMMTMGRFQRDVTAGDAVGQALQARNPFTDTCFDCGGWLHATNCDLKRFLHTLAGSKGRASGRATSRLGFVLCACCFRLFLLACGAFLLDVRRVLLLAQENVARLMHLDPGKVLAVSTVAHFNRAAAARAVNVSDYPGGWVACIHAGDGDVLLKQVRTPGLLRPRRWFCHEASKWASRGK
jgi:hypothetical protein